MASDQLFLFGEKHLSVWTGFPYEPVAVVSRESDILLNHFFFVRSDAPNVLEGSPKYE